MAIAAPAHAASPTRPLDAARSHTRSVAANPQRNIGSDNTITVRRTTGAQALKVDHPETRRPYPELQPTAGEAIEQRGRPAQQRGVGELEERHVLRKGREDLPQQREERRIERRVVRRVRQPRHVQVAIAVPGRQRLGQHHIDAVILEDAHGPRLDRRHRRGERGQRDEPRGESHQRRDRGVARTGIVRHAPRRQGIVRGARRSHPSTTTAEPVLRSIVRSKALQLAMQRRRVDA